MIKENVSLFVVSKEDINEIVTKHISNKIESEKTEGDYCYLVENLNIDENIVIDLCKDLYKSLYKNKTDFQVVLEKNDMTEKDSFTPDYDNECIKHDYLPAGRVKPDDKGINKLWALLFRSEIENISMKD